MKKIIFTLAVLLTVTAAQAIQPKVLFYGYVIEGDVDAIFERTEKASNSLDAVVIDLLDEEGVLKTWTNRKTGFYSVVLDPGKKYTVRFARPGYITKSFEIDTRDVPSKDYEEAFKMFTDVTLFPSRNFPDEHTLSTAPVAKCKFDAHRERLMWDMDYAKIAFDHFLRITGKANEMATEPR
jgi:hypothetical protein